MKKISIIGIDLAKRVFQVHGVDPDHKVIVQKKLSRAQLIAWFAQQPPCLVGMEACATAHYWAQEFIKLGHDVRLIPPTYVKAYVRRNKSDKIDAAAICEAVSRPSMRFVAVKTKEQQAIQVVHRARELLIAQITQTGNAIRAHLAEFGWSFPIGNIGLAQALEVVRTSEDAELPIIAKDALLSLVEQLIALKQQVLKLDKQMLAWHKAQPGSQRIASIPGIGVVTASAIVGAIGDGKQFNSGREFAAWIGLVPRQNSTGGKERLGSISKRGNAYLRRLLVLGATTQLRGNTKAGAPGGVWLEQLLKRKPKRLATVALANKMARIAWALLTKETMYRRIETVEA